LYLWLGCRVESAVAATTGQYQRLPVDNCDELPSVDDLEVAAAAAAAALEVLAPAKQEESSEEDSSDSDEDSDSDSDDDSDDDSGSDEEMQGAEQQVGAVGEANCTLVSTMHDAMTAWHVCTPSTAHQHDGPEHAWHSSLQWW
jgi:hypothetical protein